MGRGLRTPVATSKLVTRPAPTHLAALGNAHTEPSATQPREAAVGGPARRGSGWPPPSAREPGPGLAAHHTPLKGRDAAGRRLGQQGCRGPTGTSALLGGSVNPLLSLSGGQCWLWKTLDPKAVNPGPVLGSGAPTTTVWTQRPSPTCPSEPASPRLLPACGRKLW